MLTDVDRERKLNELLNKGQREEHLSREDVLILNPEARSDPELYDALIKPFNEAGIPVIDPDEELGGGAEIEAEAPLLSTTLAQAGRRETELISDPVRMYLREIGRVSLLNAEDEVRLATAIHVGMEAAQRLQQADASLPPHERQVLELRVTQGEQAQKRLAEANLRLVVSVAKRYVGRGMSLMDLVQEGNLGLLRAVEKFDPGRGHKFSTYATWWIRQSISRALADQARTIRIPVHMVESINRVARTTRDLQQELGRDPTAEEIAADLDREGESGWPIYGPAPSSPGPVDPLEKRRRQRAAEKVRHIQSVSQEPMSLETPVGTEESSALVDFIPDESLASPADETNRELLREQMQDILHSLSKREQEVLALRFGLKDGEAHTLEEVGQQFGVTRERIRQIEAKALRKLRHPTRSRRLRDYLT